MFGTNYSKYDFGDRIAKRRKECGFRAQVDLAEKMVPPCQDADENARNVESKRKAISNWESGKAYPPLQDFALLCETLECDPQYLLGDINAPRKETKSVMEITGLSQKAVERLSRISDTNKMTWWSSILNLVVENDSFPELLHVMTDYVDDSGGEAEIINHSNVAATSARSIKTCDLLQYKAQNLLFKILCESKEKFDNSNDLRVFYSFIYGLYKDGKINENQLKEHFEKLDNGDISDFVQGDKNG